MSINSMATSMNTWSKKSTTWLGRPRADISQMRKIRELIRKTLSCGSDPMKGLIKWALRAAGYEIRKVKTNYADLNLYQSAILGLLSVNPSAHIVIVGANDGKINDPSYALLNAHATDDTSITLIEPQKSLIPLIEKNFADHAGAKAINCAIGSTSEIFLYSIAEEIWPYTQPNYAASWPIYRAPTGITSTNRESVLEWGRWAIRDKTWDDSFVVESKVPAQDLLDTLRANNRNTSVDMLQVDAEGFDDVVLSCCNLEETKPKLIRFEAKHIPVRRIKKLSRNLESLGYFCLDDGDDIMCFLTSPPLSQH